MDFSRLTPEQLQQLQSLFNQTLPNTPPPPAVSQSQLTANPPFQLGGGSGQGPPQITHAHASRPATDPIGPYLSARSTTATLQGHPSAVAATPIANGRSSQPFLGLDRLGLSMAGQVNQRRLASAAATLPRQPRLPRRGRGPAVPAPSLRRSSGPKVEDCLSTIPDAQGDFAIRIKVKIYPPQVSCCCQLGSCY
jgi:hypothetical protein